MFKVNINNLKIKTKIGVGKLERKTEQQLIVSLVFYYSVTKNSDLNDIKNLKDYSKIIKFLKKYIKNTRYKTLEKLITEIDKELKKKFKINKSNITINKQFIAKKYGCESLSVSK